MAPHYRLIFSIAAGALLASSIIGVSATGIAKGSGLSSAAASGAAAKTNTHIAARVAKRFTMCVGAFRRQNPKTTTHTGNTAGPNERQTTPG